MSQYIPASLRQEVYDRAGGQSEYCLIPQAITLVTPEVDHIIARKHGGETETNNLALSCSLCNKYKGSAAGCPCHTNPRIMLEISHVFKKSIL